MIRAIATIIVNIFKNILSIIYFPLMSLQVGYFSINHFRSPTIKEIKTDVRINAKKSLTGNCGTTNPKNE